MRITPKFVIQALLVAIVTMLAFPIVLLVSKASAKNVSWGEIKNMYGGGGSDSTNTAPPPPPPKE